MEPRAGTKGNADRQSTHWTQRQARVSQAPERMRQLLAVWTRGGSRMRESRTYGSVRGARDETRVPTASRALGTVLRDWGMGINDRRAGREEARAREAWRRRQDEAREAERVEAGVIIETFNDRLAAGSRLMFSPTLRA